MAELETILQHIDTRLTPIQEQLNKLAETHVLLVAVQERDRHQEEELARLNNSVSEAFQVIRANKEAADARHELSKERQDKLRSEFESSRDKCGAVGKHHDELKKEFETLNKDYEKRKNYVAAGVAVSIAVFGAAQLIASDYYSSYKADKAIHAKTLKDQETRMGEVEQQLQVLTQQVRSLKK